MNKIDKLVKNVSEIDINKITEKNIIDIICEYGLVYEARQAYGEWNNFMLPNWKENGIYQTPKQIAETILELLKYDINSYMEIGVFQGGNFLLMTNFLKLKNKNLKSIGVDITDQYMNDNIREHINLHIGTSKDFIGEKYDLVFIDGDHTYHGIKEDYENVGKYAKITMFHDINEEVCPDVIKFWNEIKIGKNYKEFIYQTNNKQIHGIGLIFN